LGKLLVELPATLLTPVLILCGLYPAISLNWGEGGELFFIAGNFNNIIKLKYYKNE
jgi:hypothetical protein